MSKKKPDVEAGMKALADLLDAANTLDPPIPAKKPRKKQPLSSLLLRDERRLAASGTTEYGARRGWYPDDHPKTLAMMERERKRDQGIPIPRPGAQGKPKIRRTNKELPKPVETVEGMRKFFEYEPDIGRMWRCVNGARDRVVGSSAWDMQHIHGTRNKRNNLTVLKFLTAHVRGITYLMQDVAWLFLTGRMPHAPVQFRDPTDPTNIRPSNLHIANLAPEQWRRNYADMGPTDKAQTPWDHLADALGIPEHLRKGGHRHEDK